jgi:hypothetical protein
VLREPGREGAAERTRNACRAPQPGEPSRDQGPRSVDDAVRKYALAAFDEECRLLAAAPIGDRNNQINARSFALGQLVGAGALSEAMVRSALQSVVAGFGRDYEKCCTSIDNGLTPAWRSLAISARSRPMPAAARSVAAPAILLELRSRRGSPSPPAPHFRPFRKAILPNGRSRLSTEERGRGGEEKPIAAS